MADLTPAGNPVGRFSAEQHAALDRVFAAAEPLEPDKIDALIWALGELDRYVQLNGLAATELTPSELSIKFRAIASAAEELLQKLAITEVPWKQIRGILEHFAREAAKKNAGGFPNYPPKIIRIPNNEEYNFVRFYEDRQLQQNIEGIVQICEWARQAEEAAKGARRATKYARKDPKEGTHAKGEIVHLNVRKGSKIDTYEEIFETWVGILEKPLGTSTRSSDGAASGPLIRFTTSCLELLGLPRLTPEAIRARIRRYADSRSK